MLNFQTMFQTRHNNEYQTLSFSLFFQLNIFFLPFTDENKLTRLHLQSWVVIRIERLHTMKQIFQDFSQIGRRTFSNLRRVQCRHRGSIQRDKSKRTPRSSWCRGLRRHRSLLPHTHLCLQNITDVHSCISDATQKSWLFQPRNMNFYGEIVTTTSP